MVVDNNSKDQTRDVVDEFSHRYAGRFRYHFEAFQGKSHALNSATTEVDTDAGAMECLRPASLEVPTDGTKSVAEIARICGVYVESARGVVDRLCELGLVEYAGN